LKIENCKLKIDGLQARLWSGTGVKRISQIRRASIVAFVACLLAAGAACQGNAAERTPQVIPPPISERAQPKSSGGKKDQENANAGKSSRGSTSGDWGTTLGGLVAVLALIYLTAKVLRKSMPAAQRTPPLEVVQVLGRKPLDYRHSIHLIRCGSRLLVVGSSQEGLRTLCELTGAVEIDYLAGLCKPSEPISVAGTFNQLFRRFQTPSFPEANVEPEIDSTSDRAALRLQERLQQSTRTESNDLSDDESQVDETRESAA
jgi:flagellar biogenesis protein FliO